MLINRLVERGAAPEIVVQALRRFDETCVALTQGQYTDMSFEDRKEVDVAEYIAMITGKTAVLIALSAELGALVAGVEDDRVQAFADFGLNLGLAFQVLDDVLGIWGDEVVTGKSVATDITTRKKTLPVLYGLPRNQALRELYDGDATDGEFVRQVVALLDDAGARAYTINEAERYTRQATSSLIVAQPSGSAAEALDILTGILLRRDF